MIDTDQRDHAVRQRAFDFLRDHTAQLSEVMPWAVLSGGFQFDGMRVPLVGPQGIFKPAVLPEMPLSIATKPVREGEPRPYNDGLDELGLLNYRYRGTDPTHRDNAGLRLAMQRRAPLVYLFGVEKGYYPPAWPVFVVGDDPGDLCFKVSVDDSRLGVADARPVEIADARRGYITRLTVQRLHQATFSRRVLTPYRDTCAVCRLRH